MRKLAVLAALLTLAGAPAVGASESLVPAAREGCHTLEMQLGDVAAPFADPACTDARPGAGYIIPSRGALCSLAFLFHGPDGTQYFSTAGHCFVGDGVEQTWESGTGPTVRTLEGVTFGRARWAILDNQFDAALIEVDDGSQVSASVCHFGGPTGLAEVQLSDPPRAIHHYGYGRVYRDHLKARTGAVPDHIRANYFEVLSNVGPGDSGSSLLDAQGRAMGIIVRGLGAPGTPVTPSTGVAYAEASRLDTHLPRAEAALGFELTLVTAPFHGPGGLAP